MWVRVFAVAAAMASAAVPVRGSAGHSAASAVSAATCNIMDHGATYSILWDAKHSDKWVQWHHTRFTCGGKTLNRIAGPFLLP